MPRRNQIEMQGLVERVVDLFYKEKKTHVQIAELLRKEGYSVSKSGVGRTLLTHASQMKAYKDAAAESVAIIQELKNTPGLDTSEATVQMVQVKLLEEVKKFSNFEELNAKDVINMLTKNVLSQTRIAKVRIDYERGYRQGLFKSAEVMESEGKKAGLTADVINKVKAAILGLKVEDDKQPAQ